MRTDQIGKKKTRAKAQLAGPDQSAEKGMVEEKGNLIPGGTRGMCRRNATS